MSKYLLDKQSYLRGTNISSNPMVKGDLVYITNWLDKEPQFDLADLSDSSKYATGIVMQDIPVNGKGRILTQGEIKLDNKASLLNEGDVLYLSNVVGEYTNVAPSNRIKIGKIIKNNTATVTLYFNPEYNIQTVPDEAYNATTWNGSLEVPTKNAIRDKIETMPSVPFIQTANATVANTITETTLIGTGIGTMTIPANVFTVGKTLRLTWRGILSDTGTPTLRIRVKIGSTTIGDTGALALAGVITNEEWSVNYIMTCRTTGVTGTIFGQGDFNFDNAASEGLTFGMPSTTTTTIDTTIPQLLSITAEWGTADPTDTITSTNGILEFLN